jgi:hypothetical protein
VKVPHGEGIAIHIGPSHVLAPARVSSNEVSEQSRATGGGAGGAKGGDREEREPAKHVPGTEPGKRVTGAGPQRYTASRQILPVGAGCLTLGSSGAVRGLVSTTVPTANTPHICIQNLPLASCGPIATIHGKCLWREVWGILCAPASDRGWWPAIDLREQGIESPQAAKTRLHRDFGHGQVSAVQ